MTMFVLILIMNSRIQDSNSCGNVLLQHCNLCDQWLFLEKFIDRPCIVMASSVHIFIKLTLTYINLPSSAAQFGV